MARRTASPPPEPTATQSTTPGLRYGRRNHDRRACQPQPVLIQKLSFQIQSWIASISAANTELISKEVIGNTYEGRPMTLLKLGRKSSFAKPAIFMDCGIHAREWISPAFCQWFVKEVRRIGGRGGRLPHPLRWFPPLSSGSVYLWQRRSNDQPAQPDGRLRSACLQHRRLRVHPHERESRLRPERASPLADPIV